MEHETKSDRQPAGWFWAGVTAFAVILTVEGATVIRHGNARIFGTGQIAMGILIAAAFIGFGSFARWAVLREGAESLDE